MTEGEQWRIEGHDSTDELFEPIAITMERKEVRELLRLLTCKSLEYEEILDAITGKNGLLDVSDYNDGSIACGENPHFLAKPISGN